MAGAVRYQVMPPLASDEYQELYEDIKQNGVLVPILEDEDGVIIDGHHRARIASEIGVTCPVEIISGKSEAEKRGMAFALNLKRRHLNREQRRALIAESLKSDPQLSNREHARRTGANHETVGSVRKEMESTGEIRQSTTRLSADGRERPATQPARDLQPSGNTAPLPRATALPQSAPDEPNKPVEVDEALEARVKAMSSAPNSGPQIMATNAADRNAKRYEAISIAREIITAQKDLMVILGEVGGIRGMDDYINTIADNTVTLHEMNQGQDIDTELNNLIGDK